MKLDLYAPLKLVIVYIYLCIIVSIFGPIKYFNYDYESVFIYIFMVTAFFAFGYILAINNLSKSLRDIIFSESFKDFDLSLKITNRLMLLSSMYILFQVVELSSSNHFSISGGAARYVDFYRNYNRGSGSYSLKFIIESIFVIINFSAIVLGYFYKENLDNWQKKLLYLLLFFTIVVYLIGYGKQKQIADILIILVAVKFLKKFNVHKKSDKLKALLTITMVAFFIFVIGTSLVSRYGEIGIDISNYNAKVSTLYSLSSDGFPYKYLPESLVFALGILSFYFGAGFYGLSLSINAPFTWSHFLGSSYSVSVITKLLGIQFPYNLTYPKLVGDSTGWDESKWHTVFAWIASDLTFTGALLFYALIGYLFARSYIFSRVYKKPVPVLLFTWIMLAIFYAPANNQVVHSPGGLLATVVISLLWTSKYGFISRLK